MSRRGVNKKKKKRNWTPDERESRERERCVSVYGVLRVEERKDGSCTHTHTRLLLPPLLLLLVPLSLSLVRRRLSLSRCRRHSPLGASAGRLARWRLCSRSPALLLLLSHSLPFASPLALPASSFPSLALPLRLPRLRFFLMSDERAAAAAAGSPFSRFLATSTDSIDLI